MRNNRLSVIIAILSALFVITIGAQPAIAKMDRVSRTASDSGKLFEKLLTMMDRIKSADIDSRSSSLFTLFENYEFMPAIRERLASTEGDAMFLAPFDPTGHYEGDWWIGDGAHCPLSADMSLSDLNAPFELWGPTATVTHFFDCLDGAEPLALNTLGLMDKDGNLTYLALGCTYGICILYGTVGVGYDDDSNGVMDSYTGDWGVAIGISFFPVLGFGGKFDLERPPEL